MIPPSRAAKARRSRERAQSAPCDHEFGPAQDDGLGAYYRTCSRCGIEVLDLDG